MKRKPLTRAIQSATAAIAMTAAAQATAQTEDSMDEIVTVGSNIPRAISDAPSPVTVIDDLDIQLSGLENMADVLRQTVYNSFGSFRERSGSSFGQIAQVALRGLDADRTAVLINGRRVPGSPFTGTSAVDLNTIPLAAIERIEILTDSASAIYGADAIGGVVNVVFKDDYEGAEIEVGLQRPTREGADTEHASFVWGTTHDRGNIIIGGEWFQRDAIPDSSRAYSRASVTGPTFNDTEGVSVGGNTGFDTAFTTAFPLGSCDPSLYAGVLSTPFGLPGSGCGFAYANISLQTGNLERKSVFLNSDYELGDDMNLYFDARFTNNETSGRYAPAVGFFPFAGTSPFNTFGTTILAFHRFVGHGNRDDSVELDEYDFVLGLEGNFDNGIGYDVWAQYYKYDALELGNTYVQTSAITRAVAEGRYDVLNPLSTNPVHQAAITETGIQLTRDIQTEYKAAGITLNGDAFEFRGNQVAWAAGLEYADEDYQDIYDRFREAVDVLGSAGNSAAGDRSRWAAFGELNVPITDRWEVIFAGRYDDYDDFGSAFSPEVKTRFSPNDNLTLRASWGEGFKAPNLTDLHQSLAESFDDLTDLVRCNAQGVAPAACPSFQVQNFNGGNSDLDAEDSESFSIGAVVDAGPFSGSIDYYQVDVSNAVTQLSLAQINERESRGALPPGVIVNRGATVGGIPGAIQNIINPNTNGANLEVEGMDIRANLQLDTDFAAIQADLQWSHLFKYNEQTSAEDPVDELLGTEDGDDAYPSDRVSLTVRASRENLTATWAANYISSFENVSATASYKSWISHDFTLNWVDPFGLDGFEVTGGVRNIGDRDPSIDPTAGYSDSVVLQLYDVAGRTYFLNGKYTFGGGN